MKIFKRTFEVGKQKIILETGAIARQALGSVMVTAGETIVLVTTTAKNDIKESVDFFPLTVNYQERAYAAGNIPGGFSRREGRPSETENLISRLIDRPLRPLFPKGFNHEVQIIATVLSFDPSVPPDILAMIGASASLMLSGLPFKGPLGAARVGFIGGKYILNPTFSELKNSELDLVIAGTKTAVLMVESEAKNLPEDVMLGAILYGHSQIQGIIESISDLAEHAAKPSWKFIKTPENGLLKKKITNQFYASIEDVYQEKDKQKRNEKLFILRKKITENFSNEVATVANNSSEIERTLEQIGKELIRKNILEGKARIDGRNTKTVRPINIKIGSFPKAHGSAIFTRGETQAIVITTLGNDRNAQLVEELNGNIKNRYMLHYNFPPYSVGETGVISTPKRREIGHANLAKRATQAVFPNEEVYPYVVRVVSEITESNGSSSMATVCGASLSMMDAGIPIATPVAGIAMGLVKDKNRFAILSDILGDEDHLGDMDFKIAGTQYGITALQMDIKIEGITREIMSAALTQAKEGRLHILDLMNEVISRHKSKISDNAPQVEVIKIDPNKIRDVIGKGGITIKGITEKTGSSIDTADNGEVKIFAKSKKALEATLAEIKALTINAQIGKKYSGKVVKILDFGIFVNILPGKDGLLLFSELKNSKVPFDKLVEGSCVEVIVQNIDRFGKIKLTPNLT